MHTKELEKIGMKNLKVGELMEIEGGRFNDIALSVKNFFEEIFNKQTETEKK